MAMMASAVMLSGVTSREPGPGAPTRCVIGAGGRVISVGISAALFGLSGFRHMPRGTDLSLPGNQMTVTAQHPYRVAAPRAVKRFEQAHKESPALRALPGLAFGGNTHRRPRVLVCVRAGNMSACAKSACEIVHMRFVARNKWT
jgi:hypothetical protein